MEQSDFWKRCIEDNLSIGFLEAPCDAKPVYKVAHEISRAAQEDVARAVINNSGSFVMIPTEWGDLDINPQAIRYFAERDGCAP